MDDNKNRVKDREKSNAELRKMYPKGGEVGSQPCRSVSQGVECYSCLPKTAWPPTLI